MYALSIMLLVFCCFLSFLLFGMPEGEGWPWSHLVHAYPQNGRTVFSVLLIPSLGSSPFSPFGESRGSVDTRSPVSCFYLVIRDKQLHYWRF